MDMETVSSVITNSKDEDDDVPLPGFRFHPTDEELVGFYLKRKVEKRTISIELIKQIDIYKFDPWDLPKASNVGDKEWYFFCKRGRKYRNSIRPNRVTGSGFWKATGIDRPIYSDGGDCIGLKKSLVYYRGSAGKGTKTDWMMHEFRLPSEHDRTNTKQNIDARNIAQEAEVWTLCRIFKRNVSYRKCIPGDWKELSGGINKQRSSTNSVDDYGSSKTCSNIEFDYQKSNSQSNYIISFNTSTAATAILPSSRSVNFDKKSYNNIHHGQDDELIANDHQQQQQLVLTSSSSSSSLPVPVPVPVVVHPSLTNNNNNIASLYGSLGSAEFSEVLKHGDWDELRSMFEFGAAAAAAAAAAPPMFL